MSNLVKKVTEELALVSLDIRGWGATRSLQAEDLLLQDVPPDALVHLGNKKIFDPKKLTWVHKLRARPRNRCLAVGTRFGDNFLVPIGKIDDLLQDIEEDRAEWEREKQQLLDSYDESLNEFLQKAGRWRAILEKAVLSASQVEQKFHFGYQAMHASPLTSSELTTKAFEAAVSNIGPTILCEVAKESKRLYESSIVAAQMKSDPDERRVSQKIKRAMRKIYEKVEGLVFVDPSLAVILDLMDDLISTLPPKGWIKGNDLAAIAGVLLQIQGMYTNGMPDVPRSTATETSSAAELQDDEEVEDEDPGPIEEEEVTNLVGPEDNSAPALPDLPVDPVAIPTPTHVQQLTFV